MSKKLLLSLLTASLLLSSNLLSAESVDSDLGGFETEEVTDDAFDELDGFGDEEVNTNENEIQNIQEEANNLSINGNIAFKTSYGYKSHKVDGVEYGGFNQAQSSIYLQADYKINSNWKFRASGDAFYDAIYDLKDEPYNSDVLDTYKTQLRFDDVYLQGRITNDIDLKLGRQIVVWGKSDSIRITDVINPLDNRLPGMTDIEDLRLSTTMAKFDYYTGDWNFSAMAIVENRIFLEAAPRGEYFPVDKIFPFAPNPFIPLVKPDNSLENMQYAFAANGVFSGWDLSFYGADVLDSKWYINPKTQKREVAKIQMLGSAINIAKGSWLLKSEIALIDGVKYNSTTDAKSRLDALIGVDYMGIKDTVLSVELANRHIFDYEAQMGAISAKPDYVQEDELQTALRVTRSFENDTINVTALASMFGHVWEYGGFTRIWVEYEVMNAVSANFGVVEYLDTAKPQVKPFTRAITDNGKIFMDITYSF